MIDLRCYKLFHCTVGPMINIWFHAKMKEGLSVGKLFRSHDMIQGFFPVRWEWGRVPCKWEISTDFVHFGKSSKEYELDKLRKFTLDQHFIQTFVNYYPSSDLVFWNLCIAHSTCSIFVLKIFTLAVCSKLGIFGHLLGKKDTIWHWDWVLITDPNSLEKNPCDIITGIGRLPVNGKIAKIGRIRPVYQ